MSVNSTVQSVNTQSSAVQSEWITKFQASERLKLSPSRVIALSSSGKIQTKPGRNRQGQPINLLHAGDVERLAFERDNPAAMLPARQLSVDPLVNVKPWTLPDAISEVIDLIPALVAQFSAAVVPKVRPWLTLGEAAEYSGLPKSVILTLIEASQLKAIDCGPRPGGRYRIKRSDLDALEGMNL